MTAQSSTGLIAKQGLELLTFGTPSATRIAIVLEELREAYGLDYTAHHIDIVQGVQREAWFTALNPNGKIPVLVDHDEGGFVVFESLAIILYLARHFDPDHKISFADPLEASIAEQWIAWQHGNLSIQATANFFYRFAPERHALPTYRFITETERLYGVLESRLEERDFLAGPGRGRYSVADIASWASINAAPVAGIDLRKFPHLYTWWEGISKRPAVRRALIDSNGKVFAFGVDTFHKAAEEDPEAFEAKERTLREAMQEAREQFGQK